MPAKETFASGFVARERIVTVDEDARRVVYAVVGGPFTHDNASMQVLPESEGRCRLVWLRDMLPDEAAPAIAGMMDDATAVMARTLARA